MCIVEVYLVFLIILNQKEDKERRWEYYRGIFGGNIGGEYKFIDIHIIVS